jgi:choline dehydrogenase-like flavoprotein
MLTTDPAVVAGDYVVAATLMGISGDPELAQILPSSAPFPQASHRPSMPDRITTAARQDSHFIMPTASARIAVEDQAACCASMRSHLSPVDAKSATNNGLMHLLEDPRVTTLLGAEVPSLDSAGSVVSGVRFRAIDTDHRVTGDLVVPGANAIHSPTVLYRASFEALLDDLDDFDGSTITSGLHRREVHAALIYFENCWPDGLRAEPGRLRQSLPLVIATEDFHEDHNRVSIHDEGTVHVDYAGPSDYAVVGMARAQAELVNALSPLPVERIEDRSIRGTESYLQGTHRMGTDPSMAVVDGNTAHHQLPNLKVAGTSAFPSSSCVNPSLTAAVLPTRRLRNE